MTNQEINLSLQSEDFEIDYETTLSRQEAKQIIDFLGSPILNIKFNRTSISLQDDELKKLVELGKIVKNNLPFRIQVLPINLVPNHLQEIFTKFIKRALFAIIKLEN